MTEADWLAADDPVPLLAFLGRRASERKLRLFACACCRAVLNPFSGVLQDRVLRAVEAAADGDLPRDALARVRDAAGSAGPPPTTAYQAHLVRAVSLSAAPDIREAARQAAHSAALAAADLPAEDGRAPTRREGGYAEYASERVTQADLVRDIFGDPFRAEGFDPEWRSSPVLDLARQMYGTRDFAPTAILADALQDAGCSDAILLDHLRGSGPHVRGCWVVDAVLDRR